MATARRRRASFLSEPERARFHEWLQEPAFVWYNRLPRYRQRQQQQIVVNKRGQSAHQHGQPTGKTIVNTDNKKVAEAHHAQHPRHLQSQTGHPHATSYQKRGEEKEAKSGSEDETVRLSELISTSADSYFWPGQRRHLPQRRDDVNAPQQQPQPPLPFDDSSVSFGIAGKSAAVASEMHRRAAVLRLPPKVALQLLTFGEVAFGLRNDVASRSVAQGRARAGSLPTRLTVNQNTASSLTADATDDWVGKGVALWADAEALVEHMSALPPPVSTAKPIRDRKTSYNTESAIAATNVATSSAAPPTVTNGGTVPPQHQRLSRVPPPAIAPTSGPVGTLSFTFSSSSSPSASRGASSLSKTHKVSPPNSLSVPPPLVGSGGQQSAPSSLVAPVYYYVPAGHSPYSVGTGPPSPRGGGYGGSHYNNNNNSGPSPFSSSVDSGIQSLIVASAVSALLESGPTPDTFGNTTPQHLSTHRVMPQQSPAHLVASQQFSAHPAVTTHHHDPKRNHVPAEYADGDAKRSVRFDTTQPLPHLPPGFEQITITHTRTRHHQQRESEEKKRASRSFDRVEEEETDTLQQPYELDTIISPTRSSGRHPGMPTIVSSSERHYDESKTQKRESRTAIATKQNNKGQSSLFSCCFPSSSSDATRIENKNDHELPSPTLPLPAHAATNKTTTKRSTSSVSKNGSGGGSGNGGHHHHRRTDSRVAPVTHQINMAWPNHAPNGGPHSQNRQVRGCILS